MRLVWLRAEQTETQLWTWDTGRHMFHELSSVEVVKSVCCTASYNVPR